MFLLDSSILMEANRRYYPMDRVPEYWEWIIYRSQIGDVKIPYEIAEEITKGNDKVSSWLKKNHNDLVLQEEIDSDKFNTILVDGYGEDLSDSDMMIIGNDAMLISYALENKERIIVTSEVSSPAKKRQNRKIPDVCDDFNITCYNQYEFIKKADFSTSWKNKL